jgi:phosphoglycerol geranylgeranyltransferase
MKFKRFINKLSSSNHPLLAVLIDPDKFNPELVKIANSCHVSCFLVGGSIIKKGNIRQTVKVIKQLSTIPVILFPGDETQLTPEADGLFLPCLVSGNNPEYLIGKQVKMAPIINRFKLQHSPMAYLLLQGNAVSSTQIVTKTQPLSTQQTNQIFNTALAAQMLGFKLIYLEAGSGAKKTVPIGLVKKMKRQIKLPIIVGGGINTKQKVLRALKTEANLIVIGNALEKNVSLLTEIDYLFNRQTINN